MYIIGRQTVKMPKEPGFLFEIVHQYFISIKAGLHFQSFCSPIKALKVEFISTFRTNEKALRA